VKLITRDIDYAIRALCCIAREKKRMVSADELVKCLKMPKPFLRKILQRLNKEGILKSYKGKGGGFVLAVKPAKIPLGGLIRTIQGRVVLQEHTFKKGPCPNIKKCALKKKIDKIEKYVISELNDITLASLIK